MKSKNVCEGPSFVWAGSPAGGDQAAARARGKWWCLVVRSGGSYSFDGTGKAVIMLICGIFTLVVFRCHIVNTVCPFHPVDTENL